MTHTYPGEFLVELLSHTAAASFGCQVYLTKGPMDFYLG